MSNVADAIGPRDELRGKLDELVTTALINGACDQVYVSLAAYGEIAGRMGYPEVAANASELLARGKQLSEKSDSDKCLRSGLVELQRALEQAQAKFAQSEGERGNSATSPSALAQDPELVNDFITESREHLSAIESGMLILDGNPGEMEAIHAVFRGFHTIKGLAGFLEFEPIRQVAHEVETLLGLARNSKVTITKMVVDVVLASVDYLNQAIEAVVGSIRGAGLAFKPHADLVRRISILTDSESTEQRGMQEPAMAERASEQTRQIDNGPKDAGNRRSKAGESFSVRVQTAKLDYLMDMVGEMVITQSLIGHNPSFASVRDPKLLADLSQLARITTEVQRATMAMRMITIGQVFQRTTRMVRDLSRRCEKPVELEIHGEETELDKTIAEELADPLLHMVRNAIDHGIETPDARAASGKNPTARIKLAAYHQSGKIVIEVSDDGRGLDRERILSKAKQIGLVGDEAGLSESDIYNLIFEPGFSTAATVTDLSGRGVGMDVVRKNIQNLRGRIDIQTKAGEGTTFFLRLPLTLAIIEGLVVGVAGQSFIIPIVAVRELISPKPGMISKVQGNREIAMIRDRVLPIVRLNERFHLPAERARCGQSLLIVTECQEQLFALLVDQVVGKQEVVIKSLGEDLRNVCGIAGGAILGDGRIGLILDVDGVFSGGKQ